MRANLGSIQVYQPGTYSGSPLLFVVEDPSRHDLGPDLGWRRFIAGAIERITVEACHSTMLHGPAALQTITERLRRGL